MNNKREIKPDRKYKKKRSS
jgi:hypothetical protein